MTPENIQALKAKHNLSTSEIARLVYVTDASAYKWLSGQRVIDRARYELLLWKLEGIEPPRADFINPHQKALEL